MSAQIDEADLVFSAYRESRPWERTSDELFDLICSRILTHWEQDGSVDAATALLRYGLGRAPTAAVDAAGLPRNEAAFVEPLKQLRAHFCGAPEAPSRVTRTDRSHDFLASEIGLWNPVKAVNFALLMSLPFDRKAAVVSTMRNEGIAILEWLAYHRTIGFEDFFIYTNDNTDDSLPLLQQLAAEGVIHLIENDVAPSVSPQRKTYEHSLHMLPALRRFAWVAYLDADEFMLCNAGPDHTLDELLERAAALAPGVSAIGLNWKWFGSNGVLARSEGMVLERFLSGAANDHVKSLVRLRDVFTMRFVHTPSLFSRAKACNGSLAYTHPLHVRTQPVYQYGQINHYWNKSFEEFVLKKIKGRASQGLGGTQLDFSTFFDWDGSDRATPDPPPKDLVQRMRAEYARLLNLGDIAGHLAAVERRYKLILGEFDARTPVRSLYDARGRIPTP